jgi:HK97 family phage major capsid protein
MSDSTIIADRKRILAQAEALTSNPLATRADLKRADVLLAQAAEMRTNQEIIDHTNDLAEEIGLPRRAAYKEPSQRAKDNFELQNFLVHGGMTRSRYAESRVQEARLYTKGGELTAAREAEIRGTAMNSTTGSSGAFFIPSDFDFSTIIRQQMKQYDGIFDSSVVSFVDREHGRPLPVPAVDYTSVSAAIVAESGQTTPSTIPTVAITNVSKPSYTYRSLNMPVSIELMQDSFELVQVILGQVFGVAMARGVGADLINGNGTSAPQGLLTAASLGATSAVSGVVSAVDIESVYYSLNRISRNSPACRWVFNDKTYGVIKKLKDTAGFPLISFVDDKEVLYGKPISICPSMPDIAVSSKSIILGDLSQFIVTRTPFQLVVQREATPYIEFGQVLIQCSQRFDSKLLAVGSFAPAVYLQTHA